MNRKKTILFPFDHRKNNTEAFIFTVELAKRTKAKIIMLSSYMEQDSPDNSNKEKNAIYCHMLYLVGKYYCFHDNWKSANKLDLKRIVKQGTLNNVLFQTLQERKIGLVVFHGEINREDNTKNGLRNLVSAFGVGSVVFDSGNSSGNTNLINKESFYTNSLKQAHFYNLPGRFRLV